MSKHWKEAFYDYYIHKSYNDALKSLKKKKPKSFLKFCNGNFNEDGSNNYLNSLSNDEVWVSSPLMFNDPFDCAIDMGGKTIEEQFFHDLSIAMEKKDFEEKMIQSYTGDLKVKSQNINQKIKDRINEVKKSLFVCCFSEYSNIKNTLMWSHYANSHKGFCIEYDAETTLQYCEDVVMPVLYKKSYDKIYPYFMGQMNNEELQKITIYTKSQEWRYEKEWRLLGVSPEKSGVSGYSISVPKAKCVYIGCKSSKELKEKLKTICNRKNIELRQMKMKSNSFDLYDESISTD